MSRKEITLIKNNDKRDWTDLEWVNEFYEFLQGNVPEGITTRPKIKLTKNQAFSIIWYLQEKFSVIPDHIEQCDVCGNLYDSWSQGHHSELTNKFYCNQGCEPRGLEEREQRAEKRKLKQTLK